MEESAFWSELLSVLRSKRVEILRESPFRGTQNCIFLLQCFPALGGRPAQTGTT